MIFIMIINIVSFIFSILIQLLKRRISSIFLFKKNLQQIQISNMCLCWKYNILMIEMSREQAHIQKKIKTFNSIFIDKNEWSIHSGKWGRLQAHHSFASNTQMHVKVLQLYGNKQSNLIKCISYPQFINLKQLNLKNNKIASISKISNLKADLLEELNLGDNFITNIQQLRKLNCPNLVVISLYANRIVSIDTLFMGNFKELKVVILGLNCISFFECLNKCEWKHISKISIENNRKVKGGINQIQKWRDNSEIIYG